MSHYLSYPMMRHAAKTIASCRNLTDLESALDIPKRKIRALALNPEYHSFNLPKSDGTYRKIEAPNFYLKEVLRQLNFYLQCAYYEELPESAHGFVLCPDNDKTPRNIQSNAAQHLNCQYLFNVDFEDFFHQFTIDRVKKIFFSYPFHFSEKVASLLALLCTYRGRLPMGSPTSPVLSNLGLVKLDNEIQRWASQNGLKFTRFADDLSFSSQHPIAQSLLEELLPKIETHGLMINPEKTIWYGPNDTKIVTGIIVGKELRIPEDFYYELSQDLKRLRMTMESSAIIEGNKPGRFVRKCQRQVYGKISFVRAVIGADNHKVKKYEKEYEEAVNPNIQRLSMRWTEFPYAF